MPAPKNNTNAMKPGDSIKMWARFLGDLEPVKALTPTERGDAIEAFLFWRAHHQGSFTQWVQEKLAQEELQ